MRQEGIGMHWRIAIICAVILAQGCKSHPITWSFPAYHASSPEERIAGFSVTVQGADLTSLNNMNADWDVTYGTGWLRSAETGNKSYPTVDGTCHHGAETLSDSGDLPRFVLKPKSGTHTVTVIGCIQLLKSWDDESTPDIKFTNMMPIGR